MLISFKQKDFYHPFSIWLILFLWYLIIGNTFFTISSEKLENFISEQSFWLFSRPPETAKNITIVAIDQSSRQKLALKWPWKRSISAKLIQNIASLSPKVIGLDVIFSGRSEQDEDAKLIAALKSHPRIVLGYLLNKNSREQPFQELIDNSSAIGFVNKPKQSGVVKTIRPFYAGGGNEIDLSIETAILKSFYGLEKKDIKITEKGLALKDKLFIPANQGIFSLNYLVYHSNFTIIPASEVLDKKVNPSDIKNKIVLIGATDPIIHDEYPTPLGVFPGVTIIGNSLTMLLSGRFLHHASLFQNCLFAFLIGFLILLINKELEFFPSGLISLFFMILTYFTFMYLRSKDIMLSYFLIFFSGISAYMVLNVYKYLNLIYISNRIKKQSVFDPSTGLYSRRYFMLLLNEKVKLRQNLTLVGLKIINYKKLSRELNFDQVKMLISVLGKELISRANKNFKKTFISCLSTDTFGILIEKEKQNKIEKFTADFIEEVQSDEWKIEDIDIACLLKGCVIVKPNRKSYKKADPVFQMGNLLDKISDENIITENMFEDESKSERTNKISYKNILDFIAYDWEEKNRDLERNLKEILEINTRLEKLNQGTLLALARAIDAKSSWTAGHSERVTDLSMKIGGILRLDEKEMNTLRQAGLLHDIGKIGIPVSILDKPGKLTDEEYRIIKEHPEKGVKILQPIEEYAEVIPIAMQHHEWFNGKGYPDGLRGEEISFGGRILAVADVFDALTSDRPYRIGMPVEEAVAIIKKGSGAQFDPKVVEAFLRLLEKGSFEKHMTYMDQPAANIEVVRTL